MKLLFLILLFIPLISVGQDPDLSQFYASQLYVNPSFAGLDKGFRLYSHYRNQWPRIYSKFETYSAAADFQSYGGGGLGAIVMQDTEGEGYLKTNTAELIYSWSTVLGSEKKTVWQVGFKSGMISKSIDWSKLQFSDQIDPVNGFVNPTSARASDMPAKYNIDFSIGTLIRFTNIFKTKSRHLLGFSSNHLTEPDISLLNQQKRLPLKNNYHYSTEWIISRSMKAGGTLLYETQAEFKTLNASFLLMRKPLLLGLSFRERSILETDKSDALIIHIGFKDKLGSGNWSYQFIYSFDKTISGLAISTAGAHEISLIIENYMDVKSQRKRGREKRRPVKCVEWDNSGVPRF